MLKLFTTFFASVIQAMLQLLTFKKQMIHNLLSIYIKTTGGQTLCIDIDPKCDISYIKELVAPQMGLQPDELKVIFAGKELDDSFVIEKSDLGQQSVLHVVIINPREKDVDQCTERSVSTSTPKFIKSKLVPWSETLDDSMFSTSSDNTNNSISDFNEPQSMDTGRNDLTTSIKLPIRQKKVHFYVYCATCKDLKQGKLRVRCHFCKSGAFTVHSDPQNWTHVLEPKQITGACENDPKECGNILGNKEPTFAEFYFKCSEHVALGEDDRTVPLDLIRPNLMQFPCLACLEIPETVFAFPCEKNHIACLDCFKEYCSSKLSERQFWQHPQIGYTLACPNGCPDSFIKEIHHFRLLNEESYDRYHRFATEEFVLQSGGLLCPQPGCGMGILADPDCTRITCQECKYVFCRNCLQGFHIGECDPIESGDSNVSNTNEGICDNWNKAGDDASKTTIKVITKPCPSCKTPTERDGGCMHMVCTRAGCQFHWCWICQIEWTRECMADHWFG